ncbi:MAG TPA: ABC transporter ATP-binding protein [Ktedonobacteraceae bacterium]|nr:ABC transporter ATP-binding protein [Ktedonobacteraceae bacterium]
MALLDDNLIVQVQNVSLGYRQPGNRGVTIIEDVNFSIRRGEKFVIIGPSGCGKTTLLKAIAGFLTPFSGQVLVKDKAVTGPSPDRFVILQDFDQLFAWRTVLDNVVYALRSTRPISKREATDKALYYLDLAHVADAAKKYPHMLSGGLKQRAALARALALEPDILLMDEPFGSLDAITRNQLQLELNTIWERTQTTLILVTHSIQEAIYLGHRVMVMSASPAQIREIVDTSEAEVFGSEAFATISAHLRSLLIHPNATVEEFAQLSTVD